MTEKKASLMFHVSTDEKDAYFDITEKREAYRLYEEWKTLYPDSNARLYLKDENNDLDPGELLEGPEKP